jgi:putative MATE family efflux protein
MKNTQNNAMYYLEKAPVARAIAHMAIPMILGMIVNMVYNITDAYFIGKLENTAMLATITLALPFTTILMALGELFGTGGSTYISRLLGEGNTTGVKQASAVNFFLSLGSGILFIGICLPFISPILKLLGASGETFLHTKDYILAYAAGVPFVIANFTLGQTVRGEGAAKESMIGMIISVIVNIILDPVFIFLLGLNVMGAAIATVIGNVAAVIYYVWYLAKKSSVQSVDIKDFKPSREILSNIFKIGVSAFLLSCFLIVTCLMFNNHAMLYGDYVVAAFGVANRVCQISDFICMGLYMGVVPLIAFSYAANNTERLNKVMNLPAPRAKLDPQNHLKDTPDMPVGCTVS